MRSITAWFVALLALASGSGAESVVNGSFEQTVHDFAAGWERTDRTGRIAYGFDAGTDGARSVKIEILTPGQAAEIFQPNLPIAAGRKYTLSFKVRGDSVPGGLLKASVGGGAGGRLALDAAVPVTPEWRDYRFEFSTAAHLSAKTTKLAFSFGPAGRIWLDQVSLESDATPATAATAPRFHPRVPDAAGKNLVPNASFENGADGWLSLGQAMGFGGNLAGLYGEVVEGRAGEGARFFQLKLGPEITPETYFDCWPPAHIVQRRLLTVNQGWIEVKPGQAYTLSAYLRSDRPGTKAVLQFNFNGDARQPVQTVSHEVRLTEQWVRYSHTVVAPADSVFVGVGPDVSESPDATVIFEADAIQLEAGETATAPAAREPVELGFNTGRYGNVFAAGGPAVVGIAARNTSASAATITVRAQLTDYWDQSLPEQTVTLKIPAGSVVNSRLPLDLPPGFYRAQFSWTESGREQSRVLRLAVIEPFAHADSPFGLNHGPTTAEATRQIRQAGVTWVRDWAVNWEWAEPQPGQRSFAGIDPHIRRLRDTDMNVLSLLPANPSTNWASEAPADVEAKLWYRLAYAPKEPALLFDFVGEAAARYRSSVEYWEFLNEPLWVPDFCLPQKGNYTVKDYIALLKGASAAIHRANPNAKVVGGLAIQSEMPFGDDFIKAGGLDYVDILNLHPYAGKRIPETFGPDLKRIRGVLDEYAARKTIWATETAYYGIDEYPYLPWQPPVDHFAANLLLTDERQASDYLVRFSVIMLAHGVEKIFWHEPISGDANVGIKDIENVFIAPGGLPRKSYAAVSGLANVLGPAPVFAGQWQLPKAVAEAAAQNLHGYAFKAGGHAVLIAWAAGDAAKGGWTLALPAGATARTITGAPVAGERVALTESAVYIVSTTLTPGELARQCLPQKIP